MRLIVRLFTTSTGFPAVRYNMEKVSSGCAELLCYKNFGVVHGLIKPTCADFEHYLGAVSSLNSLSRFDQFHAVLSVRGRSMSVDMLGNLAERWMDEMGYANQPYLIFSHSDTSNTHLHLVSTDVRLDRSKISDSFDRPRALAAIHRILGVDLQSEFKRDISPLLTYHFSNLHQLSTLLRQKGYRGFCKRGFFYIVKYGQVLLKISEAKIEHMVVKPRIETKHLDEIRWMINSNLLTKDNTCIPVYQSLPHDSSRKLRAFRSELSDHLLAKKIEICYHFNKNQITGFTIIDHLNRRVVAGRDIMGLDRLISPLRTESITRQIRSR